MSVIITIAVFIGVLCIMEGVSLVLRNKWDPEARRVRKQLRMLSAEGVQEQINDITRKRELSSIPWFNRVLLGLPMMHKVDKLLIQANFKYPLGVFMLGSLVLGFAVFYAAALILKSYLAALLPGLLFGMAPLIRVLMQKRERMAKFERQLPDALDLVARSLRAGHAFSGGLQMVAQEFDDPIGTEFYKTMGQITFGIGVEQALKGLAERVDCPDLKFFAVSVIIQRDSGGNLAEILENIANLIRDRFRLRGKIRTLSAEGKLSAAILTALPFLAGITLAILRTEYVKILFTDPAGPYIIAIALLMMTTGMLLMKKMVEIRV